MEVYSIDCVENSNQDSNHANKFSRDCLEEEGTDKAELEGFFEELYKPEQNNWNEELTQLMITSANVEKIIVSIICAYLNGDRMYPCKNLSDFEKEMLVKLGFKINSSGTDLFWCGSKKALSTLEAYHNVLGLNPSQLERMAFSIKKQLKEKVVEGKYTVSEYFESSSKYPSLAETQIKMYLKKFCFNAEVKLISAGSNWYACEVTWYRFA